MASKQSLPKENSTPPPPDIEFCATLHQSPLTSDSEPWTTSTRLAQSGERFTPESHLNILTFLLQNPNLNSSILFRADILYDSLGDLKTPEQLERDLTGCNEDKVIIQAENQEVAPLPAADYPGFEWKRTVVRKLIPRNQNRDQPLDQTCHFYKGSAGAELCKQRDLVVYIPHTISEQDTPFYHPAVRALALLYDFTPASGNPTNSQEATGTISVHFLPFSSETTDTISYRLQRTLLGFLSTQLRLSRKSVTSPDMANRKKAVEKDNLIPQHVLQNTYARLKDIYAPDLIAKWVEQTEPSKHVFEDISIAAFLIELWKTMYKPVRFSSVTNIPEEKSKAQTENKPPDFPGFVDIACGNGVLVHILLSEGYHGWGFDARRRKTWSIYPNSTQEHLSQSICIPEPFMEALNARGAAEVQINDETQIHTGVFSKETFIISNHADELTLWTPLLGALSNFDNPLPFLAIPCCSHSLSGVRYRYPPPKSASASSKDDKKISPEEGTQQQTSKDSNNNDNNNSTVSAGHEEVDQNPQPATGDLKALRTRKLQERSHPDLPSSAYGSLTAKAISVARELGYDVETTLLRIPSTRNIGIVGGMKAATATKERRYDQTSSTTAREQNNNLAGSEIHGNGNGNGEFVKDTKGLVRHIVERESRRDGGLEAAAQLWLDRSLGLQKGKGRGKVKGDMRN
ncbi:hypothetical protein AJ80_09615 [Polytolypa hystricis UAMH7299]|uniref:tRNA (uracil-O(2)-)-methyltransferase n=1 Tax=Polytolypa hystricis (strain UAMH7299) TaxID=1447883 RepID=A0A2B7WN10_POLH7|nr:hypothetical protein AJ80_09615 [Polytolypa hystricis UAMH7299]